MKRILALLCAALSIAILLSCTVSAASQDPRNTVVNAADGLKQMLGMRRGESLLTGGKAPQAGEALGEWTAMSLALIGEPEEYEAYLSSLESYVTQCYAEKGMLDAVRATEYHRISLTVLALGGDPTSFGSHPDGTPINLIADGIYDFLGNKLDTQGLNADIYALIALHASGVSVPEGSRYTEESVLQTILDSQTADGGFSLAGGDADVDITAMAIQALAPYKDGAAGTAIDAALSYLRRNQEPDGGFSNGGKPACESTAQVIMALCALGLDPDGEKLKKPMGTPLSALFAYLHEDGMFSHRLDGGVDEMATYQAMFALAAAYRLRENGARTWDLGSLPQPPQKKTISPIVWAIPCILIPAAGAAAWTQRRKLKK